MTISLLHVALGGAIGSVLRYLVTLALAAPFGTITVNIVGGFAMGVAYVLLADRPGLSPLLMTGVLGGFTTFSAFSLDTMKLWSAGQFPAAAAYVGGSVILSLAAIALGATLARSLA